jgi:hypothetical protein
MNIKSLSAQYILKRWTRQGRNIIENPKLNDMLRYKNMTHKFLNLVHRAASHPRCTFLVNNTLDMLSKQVKKEINGFSSVMDEISMFGVGN